MQINQWAPALCAAILFSAAPLRAAAAQFTPGDILVSDFGANHVQQFSPSGALIQTYPSSGVETVGSVISNGKLFVANRNSNSSPNVGKIDAFYPKRYADTGQFIKSFTSSSELKDITGLAFGPTGALFVSDGVANTVWKFNGLTAAPDGSVTGGHLNNPEDITFGPDGNLYVASLITDDVQQFNGLTGTFMSTFASGNGLDAPEGLAFVPEPRTSLLACGTIFLLTSLRTPRKKPLN